MLCAIKSKAHYVLQSWWYIQYHSEITPICCCSVFKFVIQSVCLAAFGTDWIMEGDVFRLQISTCSLPSNSGTISSTPTWVPSVKMSLIYTVWWLKAINLVIVRLLFLASQQNLMTLHHWAATWKLIGGNNTKVGNDFFLLSSKLPKSLFTWAAACLHDVTLTFKPFHWIQGTCAWDGLRGLVYWF